MLHLSTMLMGLDSMAREGVLFIGKGVMRLRQVSPFLESS
jgi:hypothetical protein